MAATTKAGVNSFERRLARIRVKYPDISDAEARERTRESYRPNTEGAGRRSKANLIPGQPNSKRKGEKPVTGKGRGRKPKLTGIDVIDFTTDYLHVDLYPAQAVMLKAIYGLPLTDDELSIYRELTGLDAQHDEGKEAVEAVLALGARGGKSLLTTIMCLYESIVRGDTWRQHLQPGETAYAVLIATRLEQARAIIQRNAARLLQESPELRHYLAEEPTQQRIVLTNGLEILSLPCNSTAGRGLPIYFLALDEVAHFFVEGPKADETIYNSLSPRLAQFPGAKTVLPSTPAAKQGMFWGWFKEGFDVPGRATFRGSTTLVNPHIDGAFLDRQKARDPDNYSREFDAEFAETLASFFTPEMLDKAFVLPEDQEYQSGRTYYLGVDASGLAGKDRFGAAVAHKERDGCVVVDAVRSWSSRDSDEIMVYVSELVETYRIRECWLDQFAMGWVASALSKTGIGRVERRPSLPVIYVNVKSLLVGDKLRLPENGELRAGLINTHAYYGRNNSLSIQHERTSDGHADAADAVVTAVWPASKKRSMGSPAMIDRRVLGL